MTEKQLFREWAAFALQVVCWFAFFGALSLLTACAPTRPDPAKFCYVGDATAAEVIRSGQTPQSCKMDEKAYAAAVDDARRKDWGCLLADYGTTALGLGIGLAEANPLGPVVAIAFSAVSHKAVTEKATRDGADYPQRIENAVHCGAAAWNVGVIAGAL